MGRSLHPRGFDGLPRTSGTCYEALTILKEAPSQPNSCLLVCEWSIDNQSGITIDPDHVATVWAQVVVHLPLQYQWLGECLIVTHTSSE